MPAESADQFGVHDVQADLVGIIERVEHGEEIVISRAGRPVARVVPVRRKADRQGRGSLGGELVTTADGDADEVHDAIADGFG